MGKILKCLWAHRTTGELIVKQYGPTTRAVSLFTYDEILKHGGQAFAESCVPLEGTGAWIEMEKEEDRREKIFQLPEE